MAQVLNFLNSRFQCLTKFVIQEKSIVILQALHKETVSALYINSNQLEVFDPLVFFGNEIIGVLWRRIAAEYVGGGLAFSYLQHLWKQWDAKFRAKTCVHHSSVRADMLCEYMTWSMRASDVKKRSPIDHRCLLHMQCVQCVSNVEIREQFIWADKAQRLFGAIITDFQPRYLVHVLQVDASCEARVICASWK